MNVLDCIVLARVQPKMNLYIACNIHMEMSELEQNFANCESAENSASFIGTGLDDLCMSKAAHLFKLLVYSIPMSNGCLWDEYTTMEAALNGMQQFFVKQLLMDVVTLTTV